ncbi:DinB family protein [Chitinophaga japonensis]|uniref:Putative damage-inducible protein DinB n=1 Tax=Chitinophaga japonensis TaxID=104662 RepID=A0A562T013_CHIJA|nr:DinB family protein [Chitinophaga japonensis]TWI86693.1 putative damage-inducible protein DinB [Chitinophaga japonensis]
MLHATITTAAPAASLASLTRDYAVYNEWANQQLVDWLQAKPAHLADEAVPSSFAGIKQTLFHIWQVQSFWLGALQGREPEIAYGAVFMGSVEDVYADILQQSAAFTSYIRSLGDEELEEICYVDIPFVGEVMRPVFEIVQHTMNHSSYHRGQLITIGHQLGWHDAPMTDYMFYLLRVK